MSPPLRLTVLLLGSVVVSGLLGLALHFVFPFFVPGVQMIYVYPGIVFVELLASISKWCGFHPPDGFFYWIAPEERGGGLLFIIFASFVLWAVFVFTVGYLTIYKQFSRKVEKK